MLINFFHLYTPGTPHLPLPPSTSLSAPAFFLSIYVSVYCHFSISLFISYLSYPCVYFPHCTFIFMYLSISIILCIFVHLPSISLHVYLYLSPLSIKSSVLSFSPSLLYLLSVYCNFLVFSFASVFCLPLLSPSCHQIHHAGRVAWYRTNTTRTLTQPHPSRTSLVPLSGLDHRPPPSFPPSLVPSLPVSLPPSLPPSLSLPQVVK